jgi:long-chain acyl-CoA synthetase
MMIDLAEAFRGREVMITGVTGFLGKVALTLLLDRYPEIGKLHVLVRPRAGGTAANRFFDKVIATPPFQPLRARHGDRFEEFLHEKCHPIAGDVTDPLLGLDEARIDALTGRLACVINCAGLVTFNPSLELAVSVNTGGARNAANLCKRTGAVLVHISTCYVAGTRRGPVFENEPLVGGYPKAHGERPAGRAAFSVESELADVAARMARLRAQADDHLLAAGFRSAAVKRLREEGRDPGDEKVLRLAVGRERKSWLSAQLVQAGMDRAQEWGWPNTYTYTKAMGEQAVASSGCKYALVRPAIVESALRFPFPGWNEGFTTSAPLAFMALEGQRVFPAGHKLVIDLIPVDLVAAGILAVAGASCADRLETRVFQLGSGDVNPFYIRRAAELIALDTRRHHNGKEKRGALESWIDAFVEPYPVSWQMYQATSAPFFRAAAGQVQKLIADEGLPWGAPRAAALVARTGQALDDVDRKLAQVEATWEIFKPFIAGERFVFQCAHTRALWAQLTPDDRAKLPWDPERIDWQHYWLDIHMAGLREWVFPGLEKESAKARREVPQPKNLLALLSASQHAFGPRVAVRFHADEETEVGFSRTRDDRVTYDELSRYSDKTARALQAAGCARGSRVLLLSENRPEWAMAWFGILKAGAAAVLLDAALGKAEVLSCAAAAKAAFVVASPRAKDSLGDLPGLHVLELQDVLRGGSPSSGLLPLRTSAAPDDVASVLFPSGEPVLLTHRNLASLASKLATHFDLQVGEGVLSALPLHHLFELSAGLLTPLLLGAEINYLDEVTEDHLGEMLQYNRTLLLGGKLRVLRARAGDLPSEVEKAFHQLGFDLSGHDRSSEAPPAPSSQARREVTRLVREAIEALAARK